jgi:hypothetical protein
VNSKVFATIMLVGMTVISGCVSAGGNPELNDVAIQLRKQPTAKAMLVKRDKDLQSCIVVAALYLIDHGKDINIKFISRVCERYETSYRASVMANVREEWQSDSTVLINTANTATENLYNIALKGIR